MNRTVIDWLAWGRVRTGTGPSVRTERIGMKKLLVLVAIGTVLAAPAFAQQDGDRRGRSTVPPGGIYYYKHGGNHHSGASKPKQAPNKHAQHHGAVSQK